MTNKAWFALLAAGLLGGALSMGGCVVGSGDDDDDTGGTGNTSGGGSGGSTGGSGGATGGTGNSTSGGGTAGGGTGGASVIDCDPTQPPANPGSCTPQDTSDTCQVCISEKCCDEYAACAATDPDDSCAWGGPAGQGEITCIQECVYGAQDDGGVADDATIAECAGSCTTPSCTQATVSPQTSTLVACLKDNCFDDCLQK
jgi:hypothetical protein